MRRLTVLVNDSAGAPGQEDRLAAIRKAFRASGADPSILVVPGPHLGAAARQAMEEGAEILVAAGGDGTVSAVADVVAGSKVALAVLPMGTLNHFAKDAGLPLDLDDAARVAVHGVALPVDVAEVNGRVYVNNASIGLYPHTVRERDRLKTPGGSKTLATLRAAGRALLTSRDHDVALRIDGRPALRRTQFVFVGNNPYETSLGRLGQRRGLDRRCLGVYSARRPGRRAVLGLAARALVSDVGNSPSLDAQEAHAVTVACRRRHIHVAIDGEVTVLRTPLRFVARPGALLLMQEAKA